MKQLLPCLTLALAAAACAPSQPTGTPLGTPTPAAPSPSPSVAASAQPAGTYTLSGLVTDDDIGPLGDVTVTAKGEQGEPVVAKTAADGRYSMTLPAGAYQVEAAKAGWTTRTQGVTVKADGTLNFGGNEAAGSNPYFLADFPEVNHVDVKEEHPGGPLTLTLAFSEPLPPKSQQNFISRLNLNAGAATRFLRATTSEEPELATTTSWDASGTTLTWRYEAPYLPGVAYSVRLSQERLDTIDLETNELDWENMRIEDAQGNALGHNRADFAFLKEPFFTIGYDDLSAERWGKTPALRRWNLTHTSAYTFTAAKDETPPGLTDVSVQTGKLGPSGQRFDAVILKFTEPMRVARDYDHLQYSLLDKDKDLASISVSEYADGREPQPLAKGQDKVSLVGFTQQDPTIVYLYYPPGAFKDKKWVEVNLGVDMRDPSNNKADPGKSRMAGPVR